MRCLNVGSLGLTPSALDKRRNTWVLYIVVVDKADRLDVHGSRQVYDVLRTLDENKRRYELM